MNGLNDGKTEIIADIISRMQPSKIETVLVIGCGAGIEAAILAQKMNAHVTGIDLENTFNKNALTFAQLEVGDAQALRFSDSSFDLVYSFHALEHIRDPSKALQEMKRVVKQGGGIFLGTPNKDRLIGYIGSKEATTRQKLRWNMNDWKARLNGRFKNDCGAHCGFSSAELQHFLAGLCVRCENISTTYYMSIYRKLAIPIALIHMCGFSKYLYPAIYYFGIK